MSGRRRLPEDSVMVSIDQVHEMLAEEVDRHREETQPELPVPMAVPRDLVGGVLSRAEVDRSRAERWAHEREGASFVRTRSIWQVWRGRLLAAAVTVALVAGTAIAMWWVQPRPAESEAMGLAYDGAIRAAVDQGRLAVLDAEAAALRAELVEVKAAKTRLEAEVAAQTARADQAAVVADSVAKATRGKSTPSKKRSGARRSRRAGRARTARVQRARKPRRPRKPPSTTDKKLDSLLDNL